MSDTPHYTLSQDYELMFSLLENGPLLGFVDYEHGSTLRDPVQIKRVADGKYFEYRAGVRGFGYINAFSKDAKEKFVEQRRKYNLSFIVPNADAEARAEKAEAQRNKDLAHSKFEFDRAENAEAEVVRLRAALQTAESALSLAHHRGQYDLVDKALSKVCTALYGNKNADEEAARRAVADSEVNK